jgi:glycosyltransferase involved in cell wall biosynthesis
MAEGVARVTIVVPAYNESEHLLDCLESIAAQDYGDYEVLIVDGASSDGTLQIAQEFARRDPRFRVLNNPARTITKSLNRGLSEATGRWFIRIDAHSTVPTNYVEALVALLETNEWGGAGGRKDAIARTPTGKAIAAALGSPFGVGNSAYHYANEVKVVDHVPFGAYPTQLARELGGWNERLTANEDFEFDFRLRRSGRRLLLDPSIRIGWRCSETLADIFSRYRRYGRGKARVVALHPVSMSPRHAAAPLLVAALGASIAARSLPALIGTAGPYVLIVAAGSVMAIRGLEPGGRKSALPFALVAMHIGWGLGFWAGVFEELSHVACRLTISQRLSAGRSK